MSTKKKPKKVSHIHKFIDANKELKEGFWKGNKRREGTEHLTYTTKDEDFLSNSFAKDQVNHCEKCDTYMNAPLEAHVCREESKPECGYGKKRSIKQRGENGEWVTVEIQQTYCSAPRPEKCYCPVGYDLRGRIAKEKAKKFSDCLMEPKEPEKCDCFCHGAIVGDKSCAVQCAHCCPRDYYTKHEINEKFKVIVGEIVESQVKDKVEEKEFRNELLHLLGWEIKHSPKKRDSYRKTVIESLRKKYL